MGLHPADPLDDDVAVVRAECNKVGNCYSVSRDVAKTFLLSFCSSIYNKLLRQCQVAINPPIPQILMMFTTDLAVELLLTCLN